MLYASWGETRWGGGPSIPSSATDLAAIHRLHSHDEARRVADRIVAFGILLREGERERTSRGGFGMEI